MKAYRFVNIRIIGITGQFVKCYNAYLVYNDYWKRYELRRNKGRGSLLKSSRSINIKQFMEDIEFHYGKENIVYLCNAEGQYVYKLILQNEKKNK
jgi:hypothetical protein